MQLTQLRVKLFADGADVPRMVALNAQPYIQGFTTNPTLMRRAGVRDYRGFAREVLGAIRDKPVSFEVLADEFGEMERQAHEIAGWGANVYVKIPVTNTSGDSSVALLARLAHARIKLNVTAVMTLEQVRAVAAVLDPALPSCVSIFAGRIADTGIDPVPLLQQAVQILRTHPAAELMWASPREILNIRQAEAAGCHIITVTADILGKLSLLGYDLARYSLDTVQMFYGDAQAAGFVL
jgi:transaldolase